MPRNGRKDILDRNKLEGKGEEGKARESSKLKIHAEV